MITFSTTAFLTRVVWSGANTNFGQSRGLRMFSDKGGHHCNPVEGEINLSR
jgi:hypothetical protein